MQAAPQLSSMPTLTYYTAPIEGQDRPFLGSTIYAQLM